MSRTRHLVSGYAIVCYIPCDNALISGGTDHQNCVVHTQHKMLVVLYELVVVGLYFLKYFLAMNLFIYDSDVECGDWLVSNDIRELHKRSTSFLRKSAELKWNQFKDKVCCLISFSYCCVLKNLCHHRKFIIINNFYSLA